MNDFINFLIITITALMQSGYDFAVWYGYNKDNDSPAAWKNIYRIIKAVIDYPVSAIVMFQLHVISDYIAAFYIFKQCGGVDGIYILLWKIWNPKEKYTEEGIYWMAFTPLGLIRTIRGTMWNPIVNADERHLYIHLFGKVWMKKGIINLDEYLFQLLIGTWIASGFIIFHPITKLFN